LFRIGATSGSSVVAAAEGGDEKFEIETNADIWIRLADEEKQTEQIMCEDRRHVDSGTLEMLLTLKYNKELWGARAIDVIINKESAVVVGQKRPHSIYSEADNVSDIEINE